MGKAGEEKYVCFDDWWKTTPHDDVVVAGRKKVRVKRIAQEGFNAARAKRDRTVSS